MPGKLRVGRSADLGDRTYFFEIIPDLLVITGYDGYLRDVNTAWQNAVGWSRKELLSLPFLEFIHPEDRMRMASELEGVRKGIFMMFLESRFQCKDGTYKWFMWKAAGVPSRSKLYMLGREIQPGRDVPRPSRPDLERRARHLEMSQEWFGGGSWEVDLASMRFWWSNPLAHLLGYAPDECPNTAEAATRLIARPDQETVLAALRNALETGRAEFSFRAVRADGETVFLRGRVECVRDRDGAAQSLCGVVSRAETPVERVERTGPTPSAAK